MMTFDLEAGRKTRRLLKRIARALEVKRAAAERLTVIRVQDLDTGLIVEGRITLMVLTDTQKARITFGQPLDRKGFPAKVQDGSVTFSISDDSAVVTQDPADPFSADVVAAHPTPDNQPATITISADADLGEGVKTITGVEPLIVTSGEAAGFGPATVGEVTEQ
jgi:hypothetical protein